MPGFMAVPDMVGTELPVCVAVFEYAVCPPGRSDGRRRPCLLDRRGRDRFPTALGIGFTTVELGAGLAFGFAGAGVDALLNCPGAGIGVAVSP